MLCALRLNTRTGRPAGSRNFVARLEPRLGAASCRPGQLVGRRKAKLKRVSSLNIGFDSGTVPGG
jgi:hypothetical protein